MTANRQVETRPAPAPRKVGGAILRYDRAAGGVDKRMSRVLDVPVNVTVELGRTKIQVRNLLQLAQGSVIELDGLAGEPMDVLVNNCPFAQGEVVVVNEKFGARLTDIITPAERLRRLTLK